LVPDDGVPFKCNELSNFQHSSSKSPQPEIEADLLAQAQASGMAIEEDLLSAAEKPALQATSTKKTLSRSGARDEAVRRMLERVRRGCKISNFPWHGCVQSARK